MVETTTKKNKQTKTFTANYYTRLLRWTTDARVVKELALPLGHCI